MAPRRNPYKRPTGIYIGYGSEEQEIMAAPGGAQDRSDPDAWAQGHGLVENRALAAAPVLAEAEPGPRAEAEPGPTDLFPEPPAGEAAPPENTFPEGSEVTITETTGPDGGVTVKRQGTTSIQPAPRPTYYADAPQERAPARRSGYDQGHRPYLEATGWERDPGGAADPAYDSLLGWRRRKDWVQPPGLLPGEEDVDPVTGRSMAWTQSRIDAGMRKHRGHPDRRWAEHKQKQIDKLYAQRDDERNRRAALEGKFMETESPAWYAAQAAEKTAEGVTEAAEITGKYGVEEERAKAEAEAAARVPQVRTTPSGAEYIQAGNTLLQVNDNDPSLTVEQATQKLSILARHNWASPYASDPKTIQEYNDDIYDTEGNVKPGREKDIDMGKEWVMDQMNDYQYVIDKTLYFRRLSPRANRRPRS